MKRLESNLLNMVLSLTLISLVAAGALGGIYSLTKEPIEKTNEANKLKAKTDVLPSFSNLTFDEPVMVEQDGCQITIHNARDNSGKVVGAAVETYDKNGFNGIIRLMVGFDNDGVIQNYSILEQAETPGLGANMVSWFKTDKNKQSIVGFDPKQGKLEVSKDGGDVDAITAATISSRAFLRAVQRAYNAYSENAGSALSDATSGATALVADSLATDSAADSTANAVEQVKPEPVVPVKTTVAPQPQPKQEVKQPEAQPASAAQPKTAPAKQPVAQPTPKATPAKTTSDKNVTVAKEIEEPQSQPDVQSQNEPEPEQKQVYDKVIEILEQEGNIK